jgi:hypothetical protein
VREAATRRRPGGAASRLEITEEPAADLVQQIRVLGWEWMPGETKGLKFQDWLDLMELAGRIAM